MNGRIKFREQDSGLRQDVCEIIYKRRSPSLLSSISLERGWFLMQDYHSEFPNRLVLFLQALPQDGCSSSLLVSPLNRTPNFPDWK